MGVLLHDAEWNIGEVPGRDRKAQTTGEMKIIASNPS